MAHTLIIITYDENGGRWDHVAPPSAQTSGAPAPACRPFLSRRIPRHGGVDHTTYDTLSILKTIEERFQLPPLNQRDGQATSMAGTLHAVHGKSKM